MRSLGLVLFASLALTLACSGKGTVNPDTSGGDDTKAHDTAANDDAWADDSAQDDATYPDWSNLEVFDTCQGPGPAGDLAVGAPCTAHGQCVTGYCYDEAWKDTTKNAGFRFCTIGCSACLKSCSEWESLTAGGNTCMLLLAGESNDHGLRYRSFCMPTCSSDAECLATGAGELTVCRYAEHWDGSWIGLKKSCFPQ